MSYTTLNTISYVKLARTCTLTYNIVRQTYDIIYDIVYDIYINRCCLVRIVNSDDERDYADQQSAPHSPMAHYPGSRDPFASFLSTAPDWSVLDKVALDNEIQWLPVPVVGPAPPEISLHDAIKVKIHELLIKRYRIRRRMYVISHTMSFVISISLLLSYMILYTMYRYCPGTLPRDFAYIWLCPGHITQHIVCDIVCDIVYDIVYYILCCPPCLTAVWQNTLCLVAQYPFRMEH